MQQWIEHHYAEAFVFSVLWLFVWLFVSAHVSQEAPDIDSTSLGILFGFVGACPLCMVLQLWLKKVLNGR